MRDKVAKIMQPDNHILHVKIPRNVLRWIRWYAEREALTYPQVVVRCLKREMSKDRMMIKRYLNDKKPVRKRRNYER